LLDDSDEEQEADEDMLLACVPIVEQDVQQPAMALGLPSCSYRII